MESYPSAGFLQRNSISWLVVGFNPSEKYKSKWESFPKFGGNISKYLSCHHLDHQSSKALDDDDLQRDAYVLPWQLFSLMRGKRVAYLRKEQKRRS